MKSFTTNLSWKHGRRGALWQRDSWDRLIREDEFDATFSYVMRNPVAAGLVEDIDDWPWVRSWLGICPIASLGAPLRLDAMRSALRGTMFVRPWPRRATTT